MLIPRQQGREVEAWVRARDITPLAAVHLRQAGGRAAHAVNGRGVHGAPDRGGVGACFLAGLQRCAVGVAGGALRCGMGWEVEYERD